MNLAMILELAREIRVMCQISGESGVEYGTLVQNTGIFVKTMYTMATNQTQAATKAKTVT